MAFIMAEQLTYDTTFRIPDGMSEAACSLLPVYEVKFRELGKRHECTDIA